MLQIQQWLIVGLCAPLELYLADGFAVSFLVPMCDSEILAWVAGWLLCICSGIVGQWRLAMHCFCRYVGAVVYALSLGGGSRKCDSILMAWAAVVSPAFAIGICLTGLGEPTLPMLLV
jgi:hypothetical protein